MKDFDSRLLNEEIRQLKKMFLKETKGKATYIAFNDEDLNEVVVRGGHWLMIAVRCKSADGWEVISKGSVMS